jgi:hypothetical protein
MSHPADQDRKAPMRLAEFLRVERERLLFAWEEAARQLPSAEGLDAQALRNHLPHLLKEIEAAARASDSTDVDFQASQRSEIHALERLDEGYDLEEVVREDALLRETALTRWVEKGLGTAGGLLLNRALDSAVQAAVVRYHAAHQRALRALDRMSAPRQPGRGGRAPGPRRGARRDDGVGGHGAAVPA